MLNYPPDWTDFLQSPDYSARGEGVEQKGAEVAVTANITQKPSLIEEFRYCTHDIYETGTPYEELGAPVDSSLGGLPALKYYGKMFHPGYFISNLAPYKGKTYIVSIFYEEGRREEFEEIYDQILHTFKFLD